MATTLCFFNANNLFLRYRMGRTFPGDISGSSYVPSRQWGFLPEYRDEMFVPFRPEQTALTAEVEPARGSPWLRPLVAQAGLHDALGDLPATERWTHWWKSTNRAAQLDYLLVSPALRRATEGRGILPRIERGGIGTRGRLADGSIAPRTTRIFRAHDDPEPERIEFQFPRLADVVEEGITASDHCPVFLEVPA
ncbi:MAG: hypothetical protein HY744_05010 [Deltaproteobacteria bacterium]|nr:hypothetical protein [Deltaproteobacteria bacterium]